MPEVRLPFEMHLPKNLLEIASSFKEAGYQLFVVGGAVRDAVLGIQPHDFDLATNATPDQVINIFTKPSSWWHADETGKAFGVVRVCHRSRLSENEISEFEIATFREDMSAGRHPTVRFATIVEDVQRRDLTVNALFYDIDRREIVDMVGGLQDIELGLINTVGPPEDRFAEDRLRILRCLRFASRLGYDIGSETESAILNDNDLTGVSAERIRDEFVRSITSAHSVYHYVKLMSHYDMWKQVFPDLNVDREAARSCGNRKITIFLSLMLENNDHGVITKALNRLKYSEGEIRQVAFLHKFRELNVDNAFKIRKQFFQSGLTSQNISDYAYLRGLPERELLKAFNTYLELEPVSGDVLLTEGYSGRALGEELERREIELFKGLLASG